MKKVHIVWVTGVLCFILWPRPVFSKPVLRSPLPSSVQEITIPNTHIAAQGGQGMVLRGNAPLRSEIKQLKKYGVTDILIFKSQTSNEVDQEIAWLKAAGYSRQQIHHIPFLWKNMGPFRQTCEQTISALRLLSEAYRTPKKSIFFHCTVGEDRTGFLAGLFRMLAEKWDTQRPFKEELCGRGYEAGDARKPKEVVDEVRKSLTPAYLKMAVLISSGAITMDDLDDSVCATEPIVDATTIPQFHCP